MTTQYVTLFKKIIITSRPLKLFDNRECRFNFSGQNFPLKYYLILYSKKLLFPHIVHASLLRNYFHILIKKTNNYRIFQY